MVEIRVVSANFIPRNSRPRKKQLQLTMVVAREKLMAGR